jgi:cytochrome b6-f complex iron-sulfur subunit
METSSTTPTTPRLSRQSFFHLLGAAFTTLLFSGNTSGCSGTEAAPDPQPDVLTLNLSDKVNQALNSKGGYVITNNIVVARTNADQYVAVGGRCSHDNTILVFRPAENQFYCPLDLSRYNLSGKVISGPATVPLKVYNISSPSAGVLVIQG